MSLYMNERGLVSSTRVAYGSGRRGICHNLSVFLPGCLVGLFLGVVARQWLEPQFTPFVVYEPVLVNCTRDVLRSLPKAGNMKVAYDEHTSYDSVRVLCWVNVVSSLKARFVRHTWGRRCDVLLFAGDFRYRDLDTVDITWKPGEKHLTEKTMNTFDYVYEHHLNDADWFLRADDDTYVIMENLRHFLFHQNTSLPRFYGHTAYKFLEQGFPSGGAGYVLSKEALRRFGNRPPGLCADDEGDADIEMGRCMSLLGIKLGESRDRKGLTRFHPYRVETLNKLRVSDSAISFHKLKPMDFLNLEYFIYRIRSR